MLNKAMMELKPCPCGKTPKVVIVCNQGQHKWNHAYPGCCGEWFIEFRQGNETEPEKIMQLAIAEWNRTPRASGWISVEDFNRFLDIADQAVSSPSRGAQAALKNAVTFYRNNQPSEPPDKEG